MKAVPVSGAEGNDLVMYGLYQSLPVGAAFVDSERRVFHANRKMRAYFPMLSGGQEGLPICQIVRCPKFWEGADPCGRACGGCVLRRGIEKILCENKPMREEKWKYSRICGGNVSCLAGASCRNRRLVRWFYVSGNPVVLFGKRYAVMYFGDITEMILREKLLLERLKLDQQTKVLNKVSLLRALDALLRTERREPLAVCMVDFDDFKGINDRYGHLTGDRVLDAFCRIARRDIRGGDILGRFGGEEFLFVLKADQEQAVSILRRIQFDLRKEFFGVLIPPVTFSAGVVSCRGGVPREGGNPRQGGAPHREGISRGWQEVVKEADRLLYRAKAAGKNRISARRMAR